MISGFMLQILELTTPGLPEVTWKCQEAATLAAAAFELHAAIEIW